MLKFSSEINNEHIILMARPYTRRIQTKGASKSDAIYNPN